MAADPNLRCTTSNPQPSCGRPRPTRGVLRRAALAAALCLAGPLAEAVPPTRVVLQNGAEVLSLPGPGPLEITARVDAGYLGDPPGREGTAELVARCLTAGTDAHDSEEQLLDALGKAAGGASVLVGPEATFVVLSDVTDAEAALQLLVEMLAIPSFPQEKVAARSLLLAREVIRDERGAPARRRIAEAALARHPRPRPDAFSVLDFDTEALHDFHVAFYRPNRLSVVLEGSPLPDPAELEPMAARAVGRWELSRDPVPAAPRAPTAARRSPPPVLLEGSAASGLTMVFAVPDAGAAPAAMALRAAAAASGFDELLLASDAATPAGDASLGVGRFLILDGAVGDPTAAVRAVDDALRQVARRGVDPSQWDRLEASLSLGSTERGMAWLESRGARSAATADSARRAAAALLAGPRALVASVGDEEAAAAWRAAHPASRVLRDGEPEHAAERSCRDEGQAWIRAAVEAHGGEALLGLERVTRTSVTVQSTPGGPLVAEQLRLDADLRTHAWRQELRPFSYLGIHTTTFSDERRTWYVDVEPEPRVYDAIGHQMHRARYHREPLVLLQRVASPDVRVRSEGLAGEGDGRVRRVVVVDPEVGRTTLDFDDRSGLLAGASFMVWLGAPLPLTAVRYEFDDYAEFEGAWLPRSLVGTIPTLPGFRLDSRHAEWSFPEAPWDPLQLVTADDDIGHAATAPSRSRPPATP